MKLDDIEQNENDPIDDFGKKASNIYEKGKKTKSDTQKIKKVFTTLKETGMLKIIIKAIAVIVIVVIFFCGGAWLLDIIRFNIFSKAKAGFFNSESSNKTDFTKLVKMKDSGYILNLSDEIKEAIKNVLEGKTTDPMSKDEFVKKLENANLPTTYDELAKDQNKLIIASLILNGLDPDSYTPDELELLPGMFKAELSTTAIDLRKVDEMYDSSGNYKNYTEDQIKEAMDGDKILGTIHFKRVKEKNTYPMEYVDYGTFSSYLGEDKAESDMQNAIKYFSINSEDQVVIATWSRYKCDITFSDGSMSVPPEFSNSSTDKYTISEQTINYKSYIQKYTLPLEVQLALLIAGKDIDFSEDIMNLGFNSNIEITIFENYTRTHQVQDITHTRYFRNYQYAKIACNFNGKENVEGTETFLGITTENDSINCSHGGIHGDTFTYKTEGKFYEKQDTIIEENTYSYGLTTVDNWWLKLTKDYTIKEEHPSEPDQTSSQYGTYDFVTEYNNDTSSVESQYINNYVNTESNKMKVRPHTSIEISISTASKQINISSNETISYVICGSQTYSVGGINATINYEKTVPSNITIHTASGYDFKYVYRSGRYVANDSISFYSYNRTVQYKKDNSEGITKTDKVTYKVEEGTTKKEIYDKKNEKFLKAYDENKTARGNIDSTPGWLEKNLDAYNTEFTTIIDYLLDMYRYGKSDINIDDILDMYDIESFNSIVTSNGGNITYDFIKMWENLTLYKHYKGITSGDTAYSKGEYYTIYMEGTISNIAYGIVVNRGWNDRYFKEYGVDSATLNSYNQQGQIFKELTGDQIEEIFNKMIEEKKTSVSNKFKDLNLSDNQIDALTAIFYQYGNTGNFADAYKNYYLKGDTEGFKKNFKDSAGYNPLDTSSTNNKEGRISERVKANWELFDSSKYKGPGGLELNPEEYIEGGGNIIQSADKIHKILERNGYYYGHGGNTLSNLKNGRQVNCCSFVSWVLYDAGYINTIYNGCSGLQAVLEKDSNFTRINSMSEIKAGDIVFCKVTSAVGGGLAYVNGRYIHHVQIYAGKNSSGRDIWYNAGGDESIKNPNPWPHWDVRANDGFVVAYRANSAESGTSSGGSSTSGGGTASSSTKGFVRNTFKSSINNRTFTIVNQTRIRKNFTFSWDDRCDLGAQACITSGYTKESIESLVQTTQSYRTSGGGIVPSYLKHYGLEATSVAQNKESTDLLRDQLTKGGYVLMYLKGQGFTGKSGTKWNYSMHWVAILGYRKSNGKEQIYVGTTGTGTPGWYDIDEFKNRRNGIISSVYKVNEIK